VAEPAVVNASPLIYLSHAGLFDLLLAAGPALVVPEAVATEIQHRGPSDPTVRAISGAPWLTVVPGVPVPQAIQAWDLGSGESAVLAWAQAHAPSVAIIDDQAGRRCAVALGIPIIGTLGLALLAKKSGRIAAARPIVVRLQLAGMYLADDVRDAALALVGE
jgi:predicted nucleic acid-binding protein